MYVYFLSFMYLRFVLSFSLHILSGHIYTYLCIYISVYLSVCLYTGELWDLNRPLVGDCKMTLLKFDEPEAKTVIIIININIINYS